MNSCRPDPQDPFTIVSVVKNYSCFALACPCHGCTQWPQVWVWWLQQCSGASSSSLPCVLFLLLLMVIQAWLYLVLPHDEYLSSTLSYGVLDVAHLHTYAPATGNNNYSQGKTRELWLNFLSLELVLFQSHTPTRLKLLIMIVIHPLWFEFITRQSLNPCDVPMQDSI